MSGLSTFNIHQKHKLILLFLCYSLSSFLANGAVPAHRRAHNEDAPKFNMHGTLHYPKSYPYFERANENVDNPLPYPGKFNLQKGKNVLGLHPWWLGNMYTSYNFSLLTHVVYDGAEIDAKGDSLYLNGWDSKDLGYFARKNNALCKVLLDIHCDAPAAFLSDAKKSAAVADRIGEAVAKSHGDGLCLDFEGFPTKDGASFRAFVQDLKKKGLIICIVLPAQDKETFYDIQALRKSTDLFIVTGNGLFDSSKPGPVAPLYAANKSNCLDASIKDYVQRGIPDSSLCLGINYFGAMWSARTAESNYTFNGFRPYWSGIDLFNRHPFLIDTASGSTSCAYPSKDDQRLFWLDDSTAIGREYDYALHQNLGGVAIFDLGFDNGTNGLWNLLREKFTVSDSAVAFKNKQADTSAVSKSLNTFIDLAMSKPYAFGLVFFIVCTTLLVIFIILLTNPDNRKKIQAKGLFIPILIATVALFYEVLAGLISVIYKLNSVYSVVVLGVATVVLAVIFLVSNWKKKEQP